MRTRSPFSRLLPRALLLAVLVHCGCAGAPEDGRKVLVYGAESALHGFDVIGNGGRMIPSTALAAGLILEPLFRLDAAGNLEGVLGLEARVSAGGTRWTVPLRRDVAFHDGTVFDADAVVHHWRRILDPASGFRGRHLIAPVREAVRVDAHTVRFDLHHPWPAFPSVLSDGQSSVALVPSPAAVKEGIQHERPVGTGPFRFSRWQPDGAFMAEKNPDYREAEAVGPDVVVILPQPDHGSRFASLVSGQVDVISMDQGALIRKARNDPFLEVVACDRDGSEIVLFNTALPPLDDIRVRRALAAANDQRLHVALAYQGTTFAVDGIFGRRPACPDLRAPVHDPAAARRLLSALGRPVELELLHTHTPRGRRTGEVLQQLFRQVGVSLRPKGVDVAQHVMRVTTGDFQTATWRFLPGPDPGPALYNLFHSTVGRSLTGFRLPELDLLLEAQRSEEDPHRRRELLCRAAALVNEQVPVLLRCGRRVHLLARDSVRGLEAAAAGAVPALAALRVEQDRMERLQRQTLLASIAAPGKAHDPGEVDPQLLGNWSGEDSRGGRLRLEFAADGEMRARRRGGRDESPRKGVFSMEGRTVRGSFREVRFEAVLTTDGLKGRWELNNGYGADFLLHAADSGDSP
jgi:4-phytase/acid phosphatase/peptide/nickel transport system substrate-binding protein